jgi:prepilin-type processing-associated H-X9-DG protein
MAALKHSNRMVSNGKGFRSVDRMCSEVNLADVRRLCCLARGGMRGFTLVELLVVIGIVILIAAVAIPVFLSARESARRATCLSNERQIAMAMLQYVSDNDEAFPPVANPLDGSNWPLIVHPYLRSVTVFACQSDDTDVPAAYPGLFVDSYGLNADLMGYNYIIAGRARFAHLAALQYTLSSPSHTVMLFEVANIADSLSSANQPTLLRPWPNGAFGNTTTECGGFPCGVGLRPTSSGSVLPLYETGDIGGRVLNGGQAVSPRHTGGSNYAACDGHVKWLVATGVSGGQTAVAADCEQGTDSNQPPDCTERGHARPSYAAGTSCASYNMTFSAR